MTESNLTVKERQVIDDFQATFGTPHGQRVMAVLAKECKYNDEINCDDAMILSLWTGMRNVYLFIKAQLDADLNKEVQTEAEVD